MQTHSTLSFQSNSASWHPSKNTFDLASVASGNSVSCFDCVGEPSCPSSEITSQCTDKCVVVACSDPLHNEINCHGAPSDGHCDLVCNGTTDCTDCTGFDEFLQCCTDYHSYFSEPRNAELQNAPIPWDSTLGTFLCACDKQGQGPSQRTYAPLDPFALAKAEFPHTSNNISSPSSSSSYVSNPNLELPCMWGNCQARFASPSDLVGHVNLEHLRLPLTPALDAVPDVQPDNSPLSCLWRDCTTPQSIPTSSSGDSVEGLLNVLQNHLLHDHLGQHSPPTIPASDPSAFLTAQTNLDQQHWNKNSLLSAERSVSPIPPSSHECCGSHRCNWKGCGQSFTTCSDLTSHIAAVHVGGGKAHYECFWEGCTRNGSNGFSSKQKISRHLQSHTGHRPYQCEICLQNFSETATLQQHMRRHTQEKPYKCDYPGCGKSFAITGALTIHKRIHNGHKPFKCKFCDRAFAESSNLSKHLRTHTGARPYPCMEPGCNKTFARPDQLSRHMGVHRKGNPVVNKCME